MGFESLYRLSVIMNVLDNVSGPMRQIGNNTQGTVSGLSQATAVFDSMSKTGVVMAGAGVQIAEALAKPVTATFDTKRAIGELASLGVADLEMMENAAKDFSNTWAGTTKADFITAAYDIKSGIASLTDEGVANYTELAGMTATATKSTIATMTDLFATGYGIYKDFYSDLSDEEFGEIFSAGIATSVKQFKTNGDEMAAAISALGASATNAQVPLEEQLSILGMLQSTMSGSEAGTKYTAFLRSAVKGGEALGLSFVDANNQMLSMPEILDKLHGKFGETIDATEKMELQNAFGDSESVKLIDLMYNKTGDLQNNIVSMYDSLGQGTEATREMADAINSTDPSAFELIKQKAQNVTETIGNAVTPMVMEYGEKFSEVLDKIDTWVSGHQELVSTIFMVLAVLAAVLVVGGTVITTIGLIGGTITKAITIGQTVISGFRILRGGIGSLITAMQPMIASVWSFTSALLANPVTWIVIGIVALVAAIIILYNKCEWFRNLVNNLGAAIKEKFTETLNVAREVFTGIANIMGNVMTAAKDTINEKLNNIKQAYQDNGGGIQGIAAAAVEGVKGYYTAGFTFLDNLTGGKLTEIKEKWSEKLAPVREVADSVMQAAKDTINEKLNNIKQAYQDNGGGIQGVAAAAVEGVKGYYTAGFTFIDNLTGGKLTDVKNKFQQGIDNVKNLITNSIQWFRNSGTRIMTTFTDGITSALNRPVEAIKGGLQKIRNMLPFSDAKEGPLSQLTLSGNRVLSTFSNGIKQSETLPSEVIESSLNMIDMTVASSASPSKIKLNKNDEGETERDNTDKTSSKRTTIDKLILNVDLKTIKELKQLLKLVDEIEDYTNGGSGSDDDLVTA